MKPCLGADFAEFSPHTDAFEPHRMVFAQQLGYGRTETVRVLVVFGSHDGTDFCSARQNKVTVERLDPNRIDDAAVDSFGFQRFGRLQRFGNHNRTESNNQRVGTFAEYLALAELEAFVRCIQRRDSLPVQAQIRTFRMRGKQLDAGSKRNRVGGFAHDNIGHSAHQRDILERHVGSAVEGCGYAGIGADELYVEPRVCARKEKLVEHPAGSETAKGRRERNLAGC